MNIVQIQNRVQELPNTPQTMQYLNAALNGQVKTIPPYVAAAELQRRESEGMMDQLAKGAAKGPQPTVKDQLEQKAGIMALMGQAQPPQRPQIPQPEPREPQPQAGGIDNLPVKDDMFGMAGGGIVAFEKGGSTGSEIAKTIEEWLRSVAAGVENAPRRGNVNPAAAAAREAALREAVNTGGGSTAEQDAINAALKAAGATTSNLPAMPVAKPAARPPAAARPPVAPATTGIAPSAADLAPGAPARTLEDALSADPAYQKMMGLMKAANPYAGKQETQQEYIDRMRQGILSQTGGKLPWETSEARLKEIEDRRAKEDRDYAESTKGRQLDNLLTMISGMGRGSFGQSGAQGIQAVQKVEREQAAEDLRRKDLRDQQAMKLMEIRALNDQANFELAKGNVQNYENLKRESQKLQTEFDLKQGEIAKGVTEVGASARKGDVEDKRKREEMVEGSRQKDLERQKDLQVARIQAAARASGADDRTVQLAESAFARDPEAQAIKKRLESSVNPAKREADMRRLREIQAEKYRQFGIKLEGAPSPAAPAAGGNPEGWGKASVVKP